MKVKESTLENPPYISSNERQSGNTTRLVDHAIQLLFQDKIVIVEDNATQYLDTNEADQFLLERILSRLAFEHKIERKDVMLDRVNKKLELQFK